MIPSITQTDEFPWCFAMRYAPENLGETAYFARLDEERRNAMCVCDYCGAEVEHGRFLCIFCARGEYE